MDNTRRGEIVTFFHNYFLKEVNDPSVTQIHFYLADDTDIDDPECYSIQVSYNGKVFDYIAGTNDDVIYAQNLSEFNLTDLFRVYNPLLYGASYMCCNGVRGCTEWKFGNED
jgi:hypothetical protein